MISYARACRWKHWADSLFVLCKLAYFDMATTEQLHIISPRNFSSLNIRKRGSRLVKSVFFSGSLKNIYFIPVPWKRGVYSAEPAHHPHIMSTTPHTPPPTPPKSLLARSSDSSSTCLKRFGLCLWPELQLHDLLSSVLKAFSCSADESYPWTAWSQWLATIRQATHSSLRGRWEVI